jgi:hypothetical protein
MAFDMRIVALEQQLQNLSLGGKYRDLSLALEIKEWSGIKQGKTVQEFLNQIEQFAKISRWTGEEKASILKTKLVGEAAQFVRGLNVLNSDDDL